MLLLLFGVIAIIVFARFVFKTAKENGRNGLLWCLATVGVGVGLQWIAPVVVGMVWAIVLLLIGTRPNEIASKMGGWPMLLDFIFLALSLVGMFLVLKFVARIPDLDEAIDVPPPPQFDSL